MAQLGKNPPAMWETWVQSLGSSLEDPLEKGKATPSCILAWRIPWTKSSMGLLRVIHNWATSTFKVVQAISKSQCEPVSGSGFESPK